MQRGSTHLSSFLRDARRRRGLTLRGAAAHAASFGAELSHSTLLRMEQGRLEPSASDLAALARAYGVPDDWALDRVEAHRAKSVPVEAPIEEAVLRAAEHWRRGEFAQALGYALALREAVPRNEKERLARQRAMVDSAAFARGLGRNRLARSLLEDVIREPIDPSLEPSALILGASIWAHMGAHLIAAALIGHADKNIPRAETKDYAWYLHQRGKIGLMLGRLDEAESDVREALRLYDAMKNTYDAEAGLLLLGLVQERKGRRDDAIETMRRALEISEAQDHKQHGVNARMELGRVLAAAGRHDEGIRELRVALASATLLGDVSTEFQCQFRLWKAFAASGDAAAADLARRSARLLAERMDEESDEIREARS